MSSFRYCPPPGLDRVFARPDNVGMTSLEFGAYPPRLSDADRERALEVLREGAAQGRVSQDTFMRRTDVILRAQWHSELDAVLQDLPTRRPRSRWYVAAITRLFDFRQRVRKAWQSQRLPELLLPAPASYPFSIGRAPGSMLRLNHYTVSRAHAQLRSVGDGSWKLRDLGSSNGTWVNGSRVTGSVTVRPGDVVRFGQIGFRLVVAQPPPAASPPALPPGPPPEMPPGPPPRL
ncbi:protein of unknown function [Streptomyces sp. WMMB 714]|nr:protein of unknown function [Streptomyces sp. WMMB 714]